MNKVSYKKSKVSLFLNSLQRYDSLFIRARGKGEKLRFFEKKCRFVCSLHIYSLPLPRI